VEIGPGAFWATSGAYFCGDLGLAGSNVVGWLCLEVVHQSLVFPGGAVLPFIFQMNEILRFLAGGWLDCPSVWYFLGCRKVMVPDCDAVREGVV
jgi:hypothetical protein